MVKLGPRLWKTGLAVTCGVFLARLTGLYEVFVGLAAAFAVAPTASRSIRTASVQIGINLLAGLVGGLTILLFGANPLVIGGALVCALALCQFTGLRESRDGVITATLFVMAPHPGEPIQTYVYLRWLSIALGCVIGVAVNALIMPPDYRPKMMEALRRAGASLDDFILTVTERLADPDAYQKADILAAAARVDAEIAEAHRLQRLVADSERGDGTGKHTAAILGRAVQVLSSLLERILVLHKAALTASGSPAYPDRLPDIQKALRGVVFRRQEVYRTLVDLRPRPDVLAALEAIEARFAAPPAEPEGPQDLPCYFQRYQMRASLSEMANRVAHLYLAIWRT